MTGLCSSGDTILLSLQNRKNDVLVRVGGCEGGGMRKKAH